MHRQPRYGTAALEQPNEHQRRGFTLVELIVSVLVLSVGLLALTAATAVVARQVNGGAQMALAASLAQSRFELLRGRPCADLTSGVREQRGITERWVVSRTGGGVHIADTIAFNARGGRRIYGFEWFFACRDGS